MMQSCHIQLLLHSHVLPPVPMTQPIRCTQPFCLLFSHNSLIICAVNGQFMVGLNNLKGLFQLKRLFDSNLLGVIQIPIELEFMHPFLQILS